MRRVCTWPCGHIASLLLAARLRLALPCFAISSTAHALTRHAVPWPCGYAARPLLAARLRLALPCFATSLTAHALTRRAVPRPCGYAAWPLLAARLRLALPCFAITSTARSHASCCSVALWLCRLAAAECSLRLALPYFAVTSSAHTLTRCAAPRLHTLSCVVFVHGFVAMPLGHRRMLGFASRCRASPSLRMHTLSHAPCRSIALRPRCSAAAGCSASPSVAVPRRLLVYTRSHASCQYGRAAPPLGRYWLLSLALRCRASPALRLHTLSRVVPDRGLAAMPLGRYSRSASPRVATLSCAVPDHGLTFSSTAHALRRCVCTLPRGRAAWPLPAARLRLAAVLRLLSDCTRPHASCLIMASPSPRLHTLSRDVSVHCLAAAPCGSRWLLGIASRCRASVSPRLHALSCVVPVHGLAAMPCSASPRAAVLRFFLDFTRSPASCLLVVLRLCRLAAAGRSASPCVAVLRLSPTARALTLTRRVRSWPCGYAAWPPLPGFASGCRASPSLRPHTLSGVMPDHGLAAAPLGCCLLLGFPSRCRASPSPGLHMLSRAPSPRDTAAS